MPWNSTVTTNPEEVTVTVKDDTGGSPDVHVIDVCITWNPKDLVYVKSKPDSTRRKLSKRHGVVHWAKFRASHAAPKDFQVWFKCAKNGSGSNTVHIWSADHAQECTGGPHYQHHLTNLVCKLPLVVDTEPRPAKARPTA